jgi:hypothetical protein
MFLLDDILLAPVKGLHLICRNVEEAARQDLENQEKGAMCALGELHRRLESGQIDEKDFDLEEARLLDQIEAIQKVLHPEDEPDDADDDEALARTLGNLIAPHGGRVG